jgi:hypothetical protein
MSFSKHITETGRDRVRGGGGGGLDLVSGMLAGTVDVTITKALTKAEGIQLTAKIGITEYGRYHTALSGGKLYHI